ncbi:MAG: AAA family ATPase, partial [Oscillospiraceae bacterium]|nr:AAA family ATPase [Oscillospiraceae bacterium]
MSDNQILKLNLTMSPRAVDELKDFSTLNGVSKYEIPLIMFPEGQPFEIKAAVNDSQMILLCFNINDRTITLCGRLDSNNFFCTSVNNNQIQGKPFTLYFQQEKSEDFTYISDDVKKRLSIWYDYIESILKKAQAASHVFFCRGASLKDSKIEINTYDLKAGTDVRSLTVGFIEDNGRPSWGFGNAERLDGEVLTVKPFASDPISIMKELSSGIRLIAYDGVSDITCRRMKFGLDKLCRGEAVNKRLTEFLFDPKKANRTVGENVFLNEENLLSKTMNSEQISAVEGALNAEDLYLIQGPPGTGKTTVIAEICYQNAIRGLKTLIVSQSNLAVDNAISRVMNHADIRVLRKGDAS